MYVISVRPWCSVLLEPRFFEAQPAIQRLFLSWAMAPMALAWHVIPIWAEAFSDATILPNKNRTTFEGQNSQRPHHSEWGKRVWASQKDSGQYLVSLNERLLTNHCFWSDAWGEGCDSAIRWGQACSVSEVQIHPKIMVDFGLTNVLDANKRRSQLVKKNRTRFQFCRSSAGVLPPQYRSPAILATMPS